MVSKGGHQEGGTAAAFPTPSACNAQSQSNKAREGNVVDTEKPQNPHFQERELLRRDSKDISRKL